MQRGNQFYPLLLVVGVFIVGGVGGSPLKDSSEEGDSSGVTPTKPFLPTPNVDNTAVWNILFHFEEIELHNAIGMNESVEISSEYDPESMKFLKKFETTLYCTLSHLTSNTTVNSSDVKSTKDLPGVIHLTGKKKMVIVETDNESFHVGVITKPSSTGDIPVLQVTKVKVPLSRNKEEEIRKKIVELGFKTDPLVKVNQDDCKSFKKYFVDE